LVPGLPARSQPGNAVSLLPAARGRRGMARSGMKSFVVAVVLLSAASSAVAQEEAGPLVIGETFTIHSTVLGEVRRVNVYRPAFAPPEDPLPVLYMPDGGIDEDFLHVAGLVQVSTMNGTMRPFLLVGI